METEIEQNLTTGVASWSKIVEQRLEERIDFRTTGSIYPLGSEGTDPVSAPMKIWTVDVSTTGVQVRSYSELDSNCKRVLVRLIMPEMKGTLIEGTVIHAKQETATFLNGKEKDSYLYGLQFTRLVEEKTIPKELLGTPSALMKGEASLLETNPTSSVAVTVDRLARDVESRIPFLSAVGLVVVYVAMMLVF